MRSDFVSQKFDDIEVVILATGDNYVYVVACAGEVMAVDPGKASPVQRLLREKNWHLSKILCTHGHGDHVGGNEELKRATGCMVFSPAGGIPGADQPVREGEEIQVGSMTLRVLATPGHSENDVCYYAPPHGRKRPGMVWTGDTLFVGGCGRIFGNDPALMWQSLNRLAELPDATLVYCGHEYTLENYRFALGLEPENKQVAHRLEAVHKLHLAGRPSVPSTIASEKRTNPFLRAGTQEMKDAVGMPDADALAVFTHLRRWKDAF